MKSNIAIPVFDTWRTPRRCKTGFLSPRILNDYPRSNKFGTDRQGRPYFYLSKDSVLISKNGAQSIESKTTLREVMVVYKEYQTIGVSRLYPRRKMPAPKDLPKLLKDRLPPKGGVATVQPSTTAGAGVGSIPAVNQQLVQQLQVQASASAKSAAQTAQTAAPSFMPSQDVPYAPLEQAVIDASLGDEARLLELTIGKPVSKTKFQID